MKCVALSRMVYGDEDWCYARSLLMLAKAYHQHGGELWRRAEVNY